MGMAGEAGPARDREEKDQVTSSGPGAHWATTQPDMTAAQSLFTIPKSQTQKLQHKVTLSEELPVQGGTAKSQKGP